MQLVFLMERVACTSQAQGSVQTWPRSALRGLGGTDKAISNSGQDKHGHVDLVSQDWPERSVTGIHANMVDTMVRLDKAMRQLVAQLSSCASWDDRCIDAETPVLLDPTVRSDVALVNIKPDDGRDVASQTCLGEVKQHRATRPIELYGLNLGNLLSARKRVMRDVEHH